MNEFGLQAGKLQMTPVALNNVGDIRLIELPRHAREDGVIVVAQAAAQVPFAIVRLFTITAPRGARRGEHAHRRCTQFMLCVHGAVEVVCEDGRDRRSFVLDRDNLALCVPPTIWNTVIFKTDRSVVAVLCDRPFEEPDYVRTYREFLELRKAGTS